MATILELAEFSAAAYGDPVPEGWTALEPCDPSSISDGYFGQAYQNKSTGEIVITNRGTRPTSLKDLFHDLELGLNLSTPVQVDAANYALQIARHYPGHPIIETGHSLGGNEAQAGLVALTNLNLHVPVSAVTFNSPGIGGYPVGSGPYNEINYYNQGDVIHLAGGTHLGTSQELPAGPDTAKLALAIPTAVAAGPWGLATLMGTAVWDIVGPAHSIDTIIAYLKDHNVDQINAPTLDVSYSNGSLNLTDTSGNTSTLALSDNGSETATWTSSDGSAGTLINDTSTQQLDVHITNVDDSSSTATFINNKFEIDNFDAAGKQLDSKWQNADGSSGATTYSADGSYTTDTISVDGSINTTQYSADGTVLSTYITNADGSDSISHYSSDGAVLSTQIDTVDGARTSHTYDPLSGYTTTSVLNADGTATYQVSYQGANYTTIVNSDGSRQATTLRADGTYSTSTVNADGSGSSQTYYSSGLLYESNIYNSDGSGSSQTYNSSGLLYESKIYNADGSYTESVFNFNTQSYDSYSFPAGSMQVNVFVPQPTFSNNADGSSTTWSYYATGQVSNKVTRSPDGSIDTSSYYVNGQLSEESGSIGATGASYTSSYYANGLLSSSADNEADGSSSVFKRNLDGLAYERTITGPQGPGQSVTRYSVYANGQLSAIGEYFNNGTSSIDNYDVYGNKISDSWTNGVAGTYGSDTFNKDGSSSGTSYSPDGSYSSYTNDGFGGIVTTQYNAQGIQQSSSGNIDGITITVTSLSDGGYSRTVNDGTTTTTTQYNQQGMKIDDTWTRTDGSRGADMFNSDGSSSGTTNHADGTSDVTTDDGHGNTLTISYNVQGTKVSDHWTHADGTYGSTTFNADGSSAGIIHNPDGSYSSFADDGHGDITTTFYTTIYDASGNKLSDSWTRSDGASGSDTFNADGTRSGIQRNPDGSYSSYTQDVLGNLTTTNFAANGDEVGYNITTTDSNGVVTTRNYDASGIELNYSTTTTSSDGSVTIINYDASGNMLSDSSWYAPIGPFTTHTYNADGSISETVRYADGSHGSVIQYADGSTSGDFYNSDGSYTVYTRDALGNNFHTDYNSSGVKIHDSHSSRKGFIRGENFYNADGSSSGNSYNADGSYSTYVNDGQGNVTTNYFDVNGVQLSDSWVKADGSHGSDIYNADGTSSHISYSSNGSYSVLDTDGLGDTSTTNYDANGIKLSDSWAKADGSHGSDIFNPDTSGSGISYQVDGSYSTYVNNGQGNITRTNFDASGNKLGYNVSVSDGQGNATTTNFDASGTKLSDSWTKVDGTHGNDTFNANGSSSGTSYNSDGSYSSYTNDGMGDVTTMNYDTGGAKISDSWIKADSSYGADVIDPLTGMKVSGTATYPVKGYSDTYTRALLANGNIETILNYTYTDGSTYTTDTVKTADGSYQQAWSKSDGSYGTTNYTAATGEKTGTASYPALGTSEVFDNTVLANGSTEAKVTTTYTDSSTYTTDTVKTADGSYQQTWSKSDGSYGTTNYTAATGEKTGLTANAGAGYTYTFDNTVLGNGVTESKINRTYTDTSTYFTDTVKTADSSYQQTWSKSDGSYGTTNYTAATGEKTGTASYPTLGTSEVFDNTVLANGSTEAIVTTTYTNGSTYTKDTVKTADGSYQQTWSKSDGSYGTTNYTAATGEKTGLTANAGASYTYTFDNTVLGNGVTESKINRTYTDASTYFTDTVTALDNSYTQTWSRSDGTSGSKVVDSTGAITADSWVHADGSQGVDATINHLVLGGTAANTIKGPSSGNEIMIGGAGNDTLTTGSGTSIIAFDKGDGNDKVYATAGLNNALSLGGAFAYADLAFVKKGNDLVLDVGTDTISLKNWYASAANQNLVTLQVIAESTLDYAPGTGDVLRNAKVETFDFKTLVSAYDQARALNPTMGAWGLTQSLLSAHLAGSDTAALGGELAYDYGKNGTLSGASVMMAETTLTYAQFGSAQQALQTVGFAAGGVKLQ